MDAGRIGADVTLGLMRAGTAHELNVRPVELAR
jgi:hypothetical protein